MTFRLSNTVARLTLVFVALALTAALAYSSIRNARASHNVGLHTLQGYEQATRLEPGDAVNWYLLGHYWQYNLEESDPPRAIKAYRTSLSLDPRSAPAWLDLAVAYESEGDIPAARDAFSQAARVYPLSAEVSWRFGNFLLRQGELPQAFAQIRHAVSVEPQRAAEAFSRCWRVDPDVQVILDKVLPPNSAAYLDAIRELDADGDIPAGLAVWTRLTSLHPRLKLIDVFPFVDKLLQTQRLSDAQRVWNEAVVLSDASPTGDPPGSVLWDGGFETGVRNGGFAWFFSPPSGGVEVSLDSAVKHLGNQSVLFGFDGKHNVNFTDVCHLAAVEPGTSYLLSGWARTQSLTTNEGIRLRLIWQENSQGRSADTPDLHGTQPWTELDLSWTAPKDVHQVRVCISRNPAVDFNARIQGTAWMDDVALVPQRVESPKP